MYTHTVRTHEPTDSDLTHRNNGISALVLTLGLLRWLADIQTYTIFDGNRFLASEKKKLNVLNRLVSELAVS